MLTRTDLHIVSFDVPYPADYGGVIDVFYKLKALKEEGLSIVLHCFHYGRSEAEELKKYCSHVYYYPRRSGLMAQFSATPYIIASRNDKALLDNLLKDEAPILFEGLHTTYFLGHPKLKDRKMAVRVHNREDQYYYALYQQANSFYRKTFYGLESQKLKYFEGRLAKADTLFCLSKNEQDHYAQIHKDVRYLPVFHPYSKQEDSLIEHFEDHAIYFGNLSVEENVKAVEFLLEVIEGTDSQLKIIGRGIESDLLKKIDQSDQAEYLGELSDSDLKRAISEAKVCCLPTFQDTGIKLKLVQALFQANEILLNEKMLTDISFEEYVHLAEKIEEWRDEIKRLIRSKVNKVQLLERMSIAEEQFNNRSSAKLLAEWCARAL